jgi:hypothetical protein
VQPLQDPRKPAPGRHPPAPRETPLWKLEVTEVPVMPEGPVCAACSDGQADRDEVTSYKWVHPDEEQKPLASPSDGRTTCQERKKLNTGRVHRILFFAVAIR